MIRGRRKQWRASRQWHPWRRALNRRTPRESSGRRLTSAGPDAAQVGTGTGGLTAGGTQAGAAPEDAGRTAVGPGFAVRAPSDQPPSAGQSPNATDRPAQAGPADLTRERDPRG